MKSKLNDIIKNLNDSLNNTSTVHNMATEDASGKTQKIYQSEEAGDYIEENYKGITVYVREKYPYYNAQNDKIYYSKEEEAEDLYQLSQDMNKPSIHNLGI